MTSAPDIDRAKSALRLHARAMRRALAPEFRETAHAVIARRILAVPELASASAVLSYEPLAEEVDVTGVFRELRARGVTMALPRISEGSSLTLHWVEERTRLTAGMFGILQPPERAPLADPASIDVALVPGIAFGEDGYRLGFGAGYYDRLLPNLRPDALTVGVAYDEQVTETVPHEGFDAPVKALVTPTRTLYFARRITSET